jgi:hypothetical protein
MGIGTFKLRTTAQSEYRAPGLRISSGRSSSKGGIGGDDDDDDVVWGRCFDRLGRETLNGVGRKSAWRTDWSADVVDLVRIRRTGWRAMYLIIKYK